jgi:pimeloyl-ACP methyl ester carboxylesterase
VIAGHSSGALLAAWIAGNDPDGVAGIVLEDGPFFSTEKGRAEHTFAWLGFEVIHRFLQEEETNWFLFSTKADRWAGWKRTPSAASTPC